MWYYGCINMYFNGNKLFMLISTCEVFDSHLVIFSLYLKIYFVFFLFLILHYLHVDIKNCVWYIKTFVIAVIIKENKNILKLPYKWKYTEKLWRENLRRVWKLKTGARYPEENDQNG